MKKILITACSCLLMLAGTTSSGAALPQTDLFQDLNPGPSGSDVEAFLPIGDQLWTSANSGQTGYEPWIVGKSKLNLVT
ncbi:MAG TPA: hypothetical protein P5138_08465, partial [Solirubrobacterales bacterium]|nr:hypothetical protein [Solirubrobacterales bacterium]